MITNLLEALLKENSNQFSEVFEELMSEKLAAKVEETLQEHFEANSKLFEAVVKIACLKCDEVATHAATIKAEYHSSKAEV